MSNKESSSGPEFNSEDIEVLSGEWAAATYGRLFTTNANACTVAVVYDNVRQASYLGHFRFYREDQWAKFNAMIGDARSKAHDVANVSVWLGGGTLLPHGFYNELAEHEKDKYVKWLKEVGIPSGNITEDWLGYNEEIELLVVDAARGSIEVTKRPLDAG